MVGWVCVCVCACALLTVMSLAGTKALCERVRRDHVLELHNNSEPVYCTTHRIRE